MSKDLVWRHGIVVRGHRVASGLARDARFPEGTIRPQLAAFRRLVTGFDAQLGAEPFAGTINVRLAGPVTLGEPEHRVGPIRWTEAFPPEMFLLSACSIGHRDGRCSGWLYVPDPATKPDHHQARDVVEMLAPRVPGLTYGDPISLGCAPGVIHLRGP